MVLALICAGIYVEGFLRSSAGNSEQQNFLRLQRAHQNQPVELSQCSRFSTEYSGYLLATGICSNMALYTRRNREDMASHHPLPGSQCENRTCSRQTQDTIFPLKCWNSLQETIFPQSLNIFLARAANAPSLAHNSSWVRPYF